MASPELIAQTGFPSEWKTVTIGSLAETTQYGLSLRGEQEGAYPILRMNALIDGRISLQNLQFVDLDPRTLANFRLAPGDLLFNRTNSYELVGRTAVFDHSDVDAVFASYLVRLRIDRTQADPRFLNFLLNWDVTQGELKSLATRAVGQANISAGKLSDFSVHLPSLSEQTKIADALEIVRQLIERESQLLHTSKELKRSAMTVLFTRGLNNEMQRETAIGPIPESWELSTLGSVARLERGRFLHRPRNEPRFYGGTTPFVQTGDVVRSAGRIRDFTQTLNDAGVAISRVFPRGTILITIAANIGYTGILQFDSACPDSLIAVIPNERFVVEFLEYYLQTQQSEMDRLAPKGTQKNINIQFLAPWPVPLPPLHEQREIAAILDTIDRKIDLHRRKRALLDDLFRAFLHKLMTGEIRVTDLDFSALAPKAVTEVAA